MSPGRRLAEAVVTAALAAVFGVGFGAAFDPIVDAVVGVAVPTAIVAGSIAAANGAISGWRGIYDWSCSTGLVAFTLDSTWGLVMTAGGLFANVFSMIQRNAGYVANLSVRKNRHVYQRGFMPRKGFATTVGNVIGGGGNVIGTTAAHARRRRLITDHEDVHCWQARWLGPLFPIFYGGWTILAGAAGIVIWLVAKRDQKFTKVVESSAYYLNPLEWWAYSRDDHWPPSGKVADFGWKRPCCRPLTPSRPPVR